jgi:hypothetical protein
MKINSTSMLRLMFILGAIVDGAIAGSWFLIASGARIPNILNGHTGTGSDDQLAMYVGAMFMAGWTILLAWGAIKPVERKRSAAYYLHAAFSFSVCRARVLW